MKNSMSKLKASMLSLAAAGLFAGVVGVVAPSQAFAVCNSGSTGLDCVKDGADQAKTGGSATTNNLPRAIKRVVDILLFVLGAASVIVIVIGGFRYVTSGGDSNQVTAAKNTILYAIIGLVVAVLAYAIVSWVVTSIT